MTRRNSMAKDYAIDKLQREVEALNKAVVTLEKKKPEEPMVCGKTLYNFRDSTEFSEHSLIAPPSQYYEVITPQLPMAEAIKKIMDYLDLEIEYKPAETKPEVTQIVEKTKKTGESK